MTLGQKWFSAMIAVVFTGCSFQYGNWYIGWALVVVSVMLVIASIIHYLDSDTFDSDTFEGKRRGKG